MNDAPADQIDAMLAQWAETRPDLDAAPLAAVGRVMVLARWLERRVDQILAPYGLNLGQFDILATLRRQKAGTRMTPTRLMESVVLSSGGMTNRLDRLEEAGWIERRADPRDRRGVLVGLTRKGRTLIDAATQARFAEAHESLPRMSPAGAAALNRTLRRWVAHLQRTES